LLLLGLLMRLLGALLRLRLCVLLFLLLRVCRGRYPEE
jgi:hypothetical protein